MDLESPSLERTKEHWNTTPCHQGSWVSPHALRDPPADGLTRCPPTHPIVSSLHGRTVTVHLGMGTASQGEGSRLAQAGFKRMLASQRRRTHDPR